MANMESEQMISPVVGGDVTDSISKNGGKNSKHSTIIKNKSTNKKYWKTDTDLKKKKDKDLEQNNGKKKINYSICKIIWGVNLITLSILGFMYPLRDFVLWEKLNMRPGLPPFEWWSHPPNSTKVKTYIFNVTNHERFLLGRDNKINVQEIGPIVYSEHAEFSNISFTDNDTLTYRSQRHSAFCPEESKYNLNDTVIMPNSALLGIASMLHDSYLRRMGFNWILKLYPNIFFVKKTIHEVLWDYRDTIMEAAKSYSPGSINSTNMGFLNQMYELLKNEVTVKIGPRWGHENFFKIHNYRDMPQVAGYDRNMCLDNVVNATEGILFPQYLKKDDVPLFFSKSICSILPLVFDEERSTDGLTLYRYNFSKTAFDRKLDIPGDCRNDDLSLPSGLKDGSKCYADFPIILSMPHFNKADILKDMYVTGLTPDPVEHALGYYEVEPLTGTPINIKVRLQSNLRIHDVDGLYSRKFNKFSNLVLPLVWFEFSQEGLPPYIMNFLYFTIIVLPILSKVISTILLICGFYVILKQMDQNKFRIETNQLFRLLKK